jgi:hemerythrin
MEWKAEFSVGIPEIDSQHQTLTNCMTVIEEGIANHAPSWAVHLAQEQLADYVRIHFAVEESLMRIHRYPELDRHTLEHLEFADQLRKLEEKSSRADVSGEMLVFLQEWLHEHIMTSDKHYAAYLPKAAVATVVPFRPPRTNG